MMYTASSTRTVLMHLFTLSTLAVSQPLFDLLGANPQFFLIRDAGALELGLFMVITWLVPVTAVFSLFLLTSRLNRQLGQWTFLSSVLLFLALISLQVSKSIFNAADSTVIIAALISSTVLTLLYCRFSPARTILTYMSVIIPVAPAIFLFTLYQGVYRDTGEHTAVPQASNPVSVVMITFDELPLSPLLDKQGKIDALRFPNFALLEKTATWYRNTSTVSDNTSLAVPALLTGMLPDIDAMERTPQPTLSNYPLNLFTLLQGSHKISAEERISRLCPGSLCKRADDHGLDSPDIAGLPVLFEDVLVVYLHILLPDGMRADLPPLHQNWGGFKLINQPFFNLGDILFKRKSVTSFAQSVAAMQGIELHFLHLILPHHPWKFYPSGAAYSRHAGGDMLGIDWEAWHHTWHDNPRALEVAFQRQIMQIAYADKVLGEILSASRKSGKHDDTLFIVTSDHGANISPGEQLRWAHPENLREVMAVPLFIKYPQQTGPALNLDNVELIDILPTIDELMGINSGWNFSGQSLLHDVKRRRKVLLSPMGKPRGEYRQFIDLGPDELLVEAHPLRASLSSEPGGHPFRLASKASLVGLSTTHIPVKPSGQVAYIRDLSSLSNVKPRSNFVPGLIRTRLPKNWLKGNTLFAITLNGVVEATAMVDPDDGMLFDTVLPQRSFKPGANNLGVYLVDNTTSEKPLLLSLELLEDK